MTEPLATKARFACAAIVSIWLLGAALAARCDGQTAASEPASKSRPAPAPQARVDINHATMDQLLKVPGMTPTWAGRIVRFRPYRTRQDLVEHGVLPSDVYDRIKDYVIAHREKQ
jgi:competence protein ComEA